MPTEELSPADPRNYLGFGKQTVKGTAVAPDAFLAFVDQITFNHNPNLRDVREAGGGSTISRQNKDYIAPGIEAATPLRPDLGAKVFAHFLGVSGAPSGAGPYTHTITPTNTAIWTTFERSIADDVIERIEDAVFTDLTLDLRKRDQGPEIMQSVIATGIKETLEASATAESYETDRPFLRSDCTWIIDSAEVATARPNVESANLAFSWAIDSTPLGDAVTRLAIVKLHITCAIEAVLLFNSTDDRDDYVNTHYAGGTEPGETVFAGDFDVEIDDGGAGAAQRQIKVNIPVVNWGEAVLTEPDPSASEAVRLTRRGVMVDNPGSDPVTVTAINNNSAAYI